jgi:hypothetical protein
MILTQCDSLVPNPGPSAGGPPTRLSIPSDLAVGLRSVGPGSFGGDAELQASHRRVTCGPSRCLTVPGARSRPRAANLAVARRSTSLATRARSGLTAKRPSGHCNLANAERRSRQ